MKKNPYGFKLNSILGRIKNPKFAVLCSLAVILAILIICVVSLGIFIRPMADDLQFMRATSTLNFGDNLWILLINGRLISLLIYLVGYSVPHFLSAVPLISYLVVGTGVYKLLSSLLSNTFGNRKLIITVFTLMVIVGVTIASPIYSSAFWFSAAPVHCWSYGLLLVLISYLVSAYRANTAWSWSATNISKFIILPLVTGMMFESVSTMIIVASLISIFAVVKIKKSKAYSYSIFSLASGIISFLVFYFSVGSSGRRSSVAAGMLPRLSKLPISLLKTSAHLDLHSICLVVVTMLITALLSLWIIKKQSISYWKNVLIMSAVFGVGAYIINFSLTFMGGYDIFPQRSYFLSVLIIFILSVISGILVGQLVRGLALFQRGLVVGAMLTVVAIGLIATKLYIPNLVILRDTIKTHAVQWDERDKSIINQIKDGSCPILGYSLPINGVDDIQPSDGVWLNDITMQYYSSVNSNHWNGCTIRAIP